MYLLVINSYKRGLIEYIINDDILNLINEIPLDEYTDKNEVKCFFLDNKEATIHTEDLDDKWCEFYTIHMFINNKIEPDNKKCVYKHIDDFSKSS